MDISIRHLIDPGQLARAQAIAHTATKQQSSTDPYYTASNGLFAAKIVSAWKLDGWHAQHIRHTDRCTTSRALVSKIRGGMDWNQHHADTLEQMEFWKTLRRDFRTKKKDDCTVTIYREGSVDLIMTRASGDTFNMELRSALIAWAQTAKVDAQFRKVALDLSDDEVAWFQRKLDEPAWADAFVGFVKPNEICIYRTAAPITEPIA
jgi:hypothetical protein